MIRLVEVFGYWVAPSAFLVGIACGVALEDHAHRRRFHCLDRRRFFVIRGGLN